MKMKLFSAVVALVALASCSSEEFVGDNGSSNAGSTAEAIQFGSNADKITRATSNTGAANVMLDNQFKVYGVKSGATAGSNIQQVFVNYGVWHTDGTTTTISNSHFWEYVEPSTSGVDHGSTDNPMTLTNQTIKYWDHSAVDYRFVAGSPYKAFTFGVNSSTNAIETATVTGLAGHINPNATTTAITTSPVYIAKPLIITESDYATGYGKAPVTFNFVRQQSRVRVGIYETIPGYKITEIKFYPYAESDWNATASDNIILASTTADYFQGGANDVVNGTITYDWTTSPASYSFTYSAAEGKTLTRQKNWYGGKYNDNTDPAWGQMAVSSSETNVGRLYGKDGDIESSTGYFTVLPTAASTASPLLIKCDYTLSSEVDNSGETIKIHGATAAIPAAFCKWVPNTSYTYLFKISDNTNGKTNPDKDAVGLFPITFDAVAVAEATDTEQGVITTVTTPSITTYQHGSVTATGIEYKTGTAIYITVQNETTGVLNTLTDGGDAVGAVQVYKIAEISVAPAPTEADLQVTAPSSGTDVFGLGSQAATVDNVTLPANQHGSFTPSEAGYYAVQYLTTAAAGGTPAAYTYKVIKVVAGS